MREINLTPIQNEGFDMFEKFNSMNYKKKFLENRKIFFWGPVYDHTAKEIVDQLMFLEMSDPGKEITFYINSPGGSVTAGLAIYDTMQMISSPVSTVCIGLAASMGSLLLSGGEKGKRFIYPNAEVMIHQPSIGGVIQDQSTNLEITAEQIQKTKLQLAKILADNCGKTTEQLIEDGERDYWMDAKESLEYGIVDGIVEKISL